MGTPVILVGIVMVMAMVGGAIAFFVLITRSSDKNSPAIEPLSGQEVFPKIPWTGPTISLIPPYLVVLGGADEPPGTRKVLLTHGDSYRFEIERETDPPGAEELRPNRVRIRSVYVARTGQGHIEYDSVRNRCLLCNTADRRDKRNPIMVGNRLLETGESIELQDGAEIRIGQVHLAYYSREPVVETGGDWTRVEERVEGSA